MPYNEFRQQAEQYFEIGKREMWAGKKLSAEANFNMARAIASKNDLSDLVALIDSYLKELRK